MINEKGRKALGHKEQEIKQLFEAIVSGELEPVERILKAHPEYINERTRPEYLVQVENYGRKCHAIQGDRTSLIVDNYTPLMAACARRHLMSHYIVDFLVNCPGINLNARSGAPEATGPAFPNPSKGVTFLGDDPAITNTGNTALHLAVSHFMIGMAHYRLSKS